MEDSAGALAKAFIENLVIQVPGTPNNELQMRDFVFEDVLLEDSDEDDVFDLF